MIETSALIFTFEATIFGTKKLLSINCTTRSDQNIKGIHGLFNNQRQQHGQGHSYYTADIRNYIQQGTNHADDQPADRARRF